MSQSYSLKLTRREMIGRTTLSLAALTLGSAFAPLLAAPDKRSFKIGAAEWSLKKNDPSCFALAREIGLDGVQVDVGNLKNNLHLRQPEVQQAYLKAARDAGVELCSLAMGELNASPLKSDPRSGLWVQDVIGVAQALSVKVILIAQFAKGDLKGDQPGINRTVDVLKERAPLAEKAGVILGIENYLSASENLAILDRVGSPAVQVYYDVGNSTDKGYDIYSEIRQLKGRICEFHAKDGKFMLGQGRVDFQKVREAMDEIGYSGWIQIEAAAPKNLVEDYRSHLKFLKNIFPA